MSNDQNNGTRPNSPPVVRIRLEVDPPTRASIHVNGREVPSYTPSYHVDASQTSGAQPGGTPIDNTSGAQASHGPGNASAQAGAACSNDRPNAGRAGDAPGAPAAGGQSTGRTSHNPLPPPPRDPYRERLALARMGDAAGTSGARFGSPDPARQRSARSSGADAAANAQSGPSATQRQSGQSGNAQARASRMPQRLTALDIV
ncbi:hypothetical protein PYCCODRAFT_1285430 [Trametes coccinea BRFM310]|uniref:Uncharacterized protein n=1 Tax=Trametes coccinea (strain BRFM310) TaxID=1353009 RepID=A0A1Y2IVG7_TRAC3|nr:hypothetical protein PYCCODRAFT_1285430 [Trametes coccinea BRFM310]